MADVRILLSDDHEIVRDGLKALLEEEMDFEVVDEAKNGKEAIAICRGKKIDLVIMDINMPEMNGIEATGIIKKEFPDIKILALTMLGEKRHIIDMIKAGASGYVVKSSDREELVQAIFTILDGEYYFNDETIRSVVMGLIRGDSEEEGSHDPANLTDRELEVLDLIVKEHTNQEIADKLFISVRTVDAHRRNLLQKTGARNTAGLVGYAIKHNLTELD